MVDRTRPIRGPRTTPDKEEGKESREDRRRPAPAAGGRAFTSQNWHIIESGPEESPPEERQPGEKPARRTEPEDAYADVLSALDPAVKKGKIEHPIVVRLTGTSMRDEDWDAIRKLADERPPRQKEDAFAGPWDPRHPMPDPLATPMPAPPRPVGSRPIRRYVPRPRGRYLRPGYVPLVIAGLVAAIVISAYLGSLLGRAIYPQ